jgi:hypothetical protein
MIEPALWWIHPSNKATTMLFLKIIMVSFMNQNKKEFMPTPIIFGLEINTYSENTEQIAPELSSKLHKYLEEIPLTFLRNKCYD